MQKFFSSVEYKKKRKIIQYRPCAEVLQYPQHILITIHVY